LWRQISFAALKNAATDVGIKANPGGTVTAAG